MPLVARPPSQELTNLVAALGGSWHGRTAICHCPAHGDGTPSLSLRQGDRGVLVTCFAGCAREDVLRELSRVRPSTGAPLPPSGSDRGRANVLRIWGEALDVGGTLGARYLQLRDLPTDLADVRFHSRCPHGPAPFTRFKPALLIAVREQHTLTALHRIFLDPSTAEVETKAMLGTPGQGAWRGGRSGAVLAIAEGFETAAAFAALHGIPCWAALGARRLDQLALPATISTLVIAEDNDAEGRRAAARAEQRYARPGLELVRAPPPRGFKDWAVRDLAMACGFSRVATPRLTAGRRGRGA